MKFHVRARTTGDYALGAWGLIALALLPLGAWLVDSGHLDLGTCSFKRFLGVPCLTCGATRATIALFHGEVAEAFRLQPFVMSLYGFMLIWGVVSLTAKLTRRAVSVELGDAEDAALKVVIVLAPVLNWIYLWKAGI